MPVHVVPFPSMPRSCIVYAIHTRQLVLNGGVIESELEPTYDVQAS